MAEAEGQTEADGQARKRLTIVAGSLLATAALLYLVLRLGAWGFETKRRNLHEGRLARLLEQRPVAEQVSEAFRNEGTRALGIARSPERLRRVAAQHAGGAAEAVVREGSRWAETRVFLAGDMVYFIHFDRDGVMRAYQYVSR
jgi:hypothetical protein